MSDEISWYFTAKATSGVSFTIGGKTVAEATVAASSITLDAAMASQKDLSLQLGSVDALVFVAMKSTVEDGSVGVQAGGANPTKLTGPLILFGDAIGLFTADLTTLRAQNTHPTDAAELSVLIGLSLTA